MCVDYLFLYLTSVECSLWASLKLAANIISGEADVPFWVPISLLLKLLSLFCMLLLWINAKNVLYLLLYSISVFLWLSAKFCTERTFFLIFFFCFLFVFLKFFLVIKAFEYTVLVPRTSLSSRSSLVVLRQSP